MSGRFVKTATNARRRTQPSEPCGPATSTMRVKLSGLIHVFRPLIETSGVVEIPRRLMEKHERLYKMAADFADFRAGWLLIVEPRQQAATGEMVLASFKGDIYIGRWWGKHGKRELIVEDSLKNMSGVEILGAINQIVGVS